MFLGWGLNPHLKNLAVNCQLSTVNCLSEIVRVLKPGGIVLLADIVNQAEYAEYLRRCGMEDLQLHNNTSRDAVLKVITFGSFAPSAILARKAVSQSDER